MYVTCLLFVFVVLGGIARVTGFSLIKFLKYISEEILIVLGTSSSESALPKIMEKLERIGCPKPVVGLVVPTGYSFNLDGTSIYMTMARAVRGAGERRASVIRPAVVGARHSAADLERRGGGDRQPASSRWPRRCRRSRTSRSPAWRCCSASIASCPKRARSRTSSAMRSRRWSWRDGTARSTWREPIACSHAAYLSCTTSGQIPSRANWRHFETTRWLCRERGGKRFGGSS